MLWFIRILPDYSRLLRRLPLLFLSQLNHLHGQRITKADEELAAAIQRRTIKFYLPSRSIDARL